MGIFIDQEKGLFANTRLLIFGGTNSIQTVKDEQYLAFFAKASAIQLPCYKYEKN